MENIKQVKLERIDPDGLYIIFIIPGFWSESNPYDITVASIGEEILGHNNKDNSMWRWIAHMRSKIWFDECIEKEFIDLVNQKKHLYKEFKN